MTVVQGLSDRFRRRSAAVETRVRAGLGRFRRSDAVVEERAPAPGPTPETRPRWSTTTTTPRAATTSDARDLPVEFDPGFYRSSYADLADLSDAEAAEHWRRYGRAEGRLGSPAATRRGFMALLLGQPSILEIGPLANPCVVGPQVRYFDVLPTEALRTKAIEHGLDVSRFPDIHYFSETADLSVVPDRFAAVVSSHAIEHQPDLVKHLRDVHRLLLPSGRYWLAVPDHRYCFDHFLPPSSIADVLDAYVRGATRHSAANVINMMAMGTHNDAGRHWAGDHGAPQYVHAHETLEQAMSTFIAGEDTYLDTHAWKFTPESFEEIISLLYEMGLSPLRPVRVLPTTRGQFEFFAVLEVGREEGNAATS